MATYAKTKQSPQENPVTIKTTWKTNTPSGALVYAVELGLEKSKSPIKLDLNISRAIWSPEVYAGVTKAIFDALSLNPSDITESEASDNTLLERLTDLSAGNIEKENRNLSSKLEQHFLDAKLHKDAAVVLGAFMLRDSSRDFFDLRAPLCRMTAHLAFARAA